MSSIIATNPLPLPSDRSDSFTERNAVSKRYEQTTDFVIPAGAFYVKIENAGEVGTGTLSVATVNGEELDVRATPIVFNKQENQASKEVILSPDYEIKTNGAMIFATVHR